MQQLLLPEGSRFSTAENQAACATIADLTTAMQQGTILEGIATSCDAAHNLHIQLPCGHAVMPRTDCALGIAEGTARDIAILSRVGRVVCFRVTSVQPLEISRRAVQAQALAHLLATVQSGDVLPAQITHIEPFGVFVDVGAGVTSFIGIEHLSVSRIAHPRERFAVGQPLYAVVLAIDHAKQRLILTHRELLGTWEQNAALFHIGQTVFGVVRSVESYGAFIELTPNLSGLAECRFGVQNGDAVSVYIKSITPERMKVKLNIVDVVQRPPQQPKPLHYFIQQGRLERWQYSPESCQSKQVVTVFADLA